MLELIHRRAAKKKNVEKSVEKRKKIITNNRHVAWLFAENLKMGQAKVFLEREKY